MQTPKHLVDYALRGANPPYQKNGFTLIELLIVIVIISIISSVAVISIRFNQSKQFETFANHLANLIKLAEEEAMLRPAILGLAFTKNSYRFYEYLETKKSWIIVTDKNLGLHEIPDNTQITLNMQGKNRELNGKPQIIISSSGDISPFKIFIGKKESAAQYQVIGKANGEVKSAAVE